MTSSSSAIKTGFLAPRDVTAARLLAFADMGETDFCKWLETAPTPSACCPRNFEGVISDVFTECDEKIEFHDSLVYHERDGMHLYAAAPVQTSSCCFMLIVSEKADTANGRAMLKGEQHLFFQAAFLREIARAGNKYKRSAGCIFMTPDGSNCFVEVFSKTRIDKELPHFRNLLKRYGYFLRGEPEPLLITTEDRDIPDELGISEGIEERILKQSLIYAERRKQATLIRTARNNAAALFLTPHLPIKKDTAVHIISNGDFDTWDLYEHLLKSAAPLTFFGISTFTFNDVTAKRLAALIAENPQCLFVLILSKSLKGQNPATYHFIRLYQERTPNFFMIETSHHTKLAICEGPAGHYVLEGSANLNENIRIEQLTITESKQYYDFLRREYFNVDSATPANWQRAIDDSSALETPRGD